MDSSKKPISFGGPAYVSQFSKKHIRFHWDVSDYRLSEASISMAAPGAKDKNKYLEYHKQFARAAKSESLEYGVYSACDALIAGWASTLGDELGVVIQDIYLASVANKVNLLALIKAISMLDYDRLHPHGSMIALASLSHKDTEVVEAGIRAYEHWESRAGIDALRNAIVREGWLDKYRTETVSYLESL